MGRGVVNWGNLPSGEPLDLTTCAREPIHIPGSIQPHGLLLALGDDPELSVLQLSNNTQRYLGASPEQLLGAPLSRVLDAESANRVRAARDLESENENERDASPLRVRASNQASPREFDAILRIGTALR